MTLSFFPHPYYLLCHQERWCYVAFLKIVPQYPLQYFLPSHGHSVCQSWSQYFLIFQNFSERFLENNQSSYFSLKLSFNSCWQKDQGIAIASHNQKHGQIQQQLWLDCSLSDRDYKMPPVLRDPDFRNVKIWESRCFRISEVCIRVAKFFYSCNNLKICSKLLHMPYLTPSYLELLWVNPCPINIKKCPCKNQLNCKTTSSFQSFILWFIKGHGTDAHWELLTYESKEREVVLGIQTCSGVRVFPLLCSIEEHNYRVFCYFKISKFWILSL